MPSFSRAALSLKGSLDFSFWFRSLRFWLVMGGGGRAAGVNQSFKFSILLLANARKSLLLNFVASTCIILGSSFKTNNKMSGIIMVVTSIETSHCV